MRQYNFLKDDWNGSPKTVWSRKKQNKLFKLLIKKYPTAKDLRKKLFQINTEDSIKLGNYINPKWDYEQYYRFITSNVIKYSSAGKIILSQLVGAAVGTGIYAGVNKYLEKGLSNYDRTLLNFSNEEKRRIVNDGENRSVLNDIADADSRALQAGYKKGTKYSPFIAGLGGKSLASYATFKLLDKLDK